jgi:hypothetical protein
MHFNSILVEFHSRRSKAIAKGTKLRRIWVWLMEVLKGLQISMATCGGMALAQLAMWRFWKVRNGLGGDATDDVEIGSNWKTCLNIFLLLA